MKPTKSINQIILLGLALSQLLLLVGCSKIEREQLFEIPYPPLDFTLPAGVPPTSLWVQDYPALTSAFTALAQQNGVDTALVAGVFPLRARLSSRDGTVLDFFNSIQVLLCKAGTRECSLLGDEIFFIDQLLGRGDIIINLQPGLRNVKDEFGEEVIHLQLVFNFNRPTPGTIDCRFDMTFEAVQ